MCPHVHECAGMSTRSRRGGTKEGIRRRMTCSNALLTTDVSFSLSICGPTTQVCSSAHPGPHKPKILIAVHEWSKPLWLFDPVPFDHLPSQNLGHVHLIYLRHSLLMNFHPAWSFFGDKNQVSFLLSPSNQERSPQPLLSSLCCTPATSACSPLPSLGCPYVWQFDHSLTQSVCLATSPPSASPHPSSPCTQHNQQALTHDNPPSSSLLFLCCCLSPPLVAASCIFPLACTHTQTLTHTHLHTHTHTHTGP